MPKDTEHRVLDEDGNPVLDGPEYRAKLREKLRKTRKVGKETVEEFDNQFHPHLGESALKVRATIGTFKDGTPIHVDEIGKHDKHVKEADGQI